MRSRSDVSPLLYVEMARNVACVPKNAELARDAAPPPNQDAREYRVFLSKLNKPPQQSNDTVELLRSAATIARKFSLSFFRYDDQVLPIAHAPQFLS
jgi:hypothetical protein